MKPRSDLEAMGLGGGIPTGLHLPGGGAPVGVQDGLLEGALETQTSSAALSGKLIFIRDGNFNCAFFAGLDFLFFLDSRVPVLASGGRIWWKLYGSTMALER